MFQHSTYNLIVADTPHCSIKLERMFSEWEETDWPQAYELLRREYQSQLFSRGS